MSKRMGEMDVYLGMVFVGMIISIFAGGAAYLNDPKQFEEGFPNYNKIPARYLMFLVIGNAMFYIGLIISGIKFLITLFTGL